MAERKPYRPFAVERDWAAEDEAARKKYVRPRKVPELRVSATEPSSFFPAAGAPRDTTPRNLNARISKQASISAPRESIVQRAYNALERATPTTSGRDIAQGIEWLLNPRALYESAGRAGGSLFAAAGAPSWLGSDVYGGNTDLLRQDRDTLALNAVFGALGYAGRPLKAAANKAFGVLPAGAREGISDLGAKGAQWARENAPLLSRGASAPLRDPDFIEGVARAVPEEMGAFAARPQQGRIGTTYQQPQALPAAEERLALPAPDPGLPEFAAKPRGGQFYPDTSLGPIDAQAAGYKLDNYTGRQGEDVYQVLGPSGNPINSYRASTPEGAWKLADAHFEQNRGVSNLSPEAAARAAALEALPFDETTSAWLEKALAKYYKTDFGSPNDPLRSLAERGLHYDPEMTPERWLKEVNRSLMEDPIGYFTVPRHESSIRAEYAAAPDDLSGQLQGASFFGANAPIAQGALMQAAPWLRKQPVTDMLYGIRDPLDLGHFGDEFSNALRAEEVGLPADLAVRPEMLERMSFPQAVERVGRINQFRAKEMERAALEASSGPATQMFKEYPEDNPMGLRWVELRMPEPALPEGAEVRAVPGWEGFEVVDPRTGMTFSRGATEDEARRLYNREERMQQLQGALKYEGDTMGHCVGGYCPDVASGNTRIFSLRDAKGEPHVTIETKPGNPSELYRQELAAMRERGQMDEWTSWLREQASQPDYEVPQNGFDAINAWRATQGLEPLDVQVPEIIKQVKGKQNLKPKEKYIPYVQDFIKSGQWGDVGDMHHTDLVRLPDGRFVTQQQYDEGMSRAFGENAPELLSNKRLYGPDWFERNWAEAAPYFEGYATGGRVAADDCSCHNPLAVPGKKAPSLKVKK